MKSKNIKDQRGLALIAIIFLLLMLLFIASTKMVVITGTELSNLNQEIALTYAESHALETGSPIREKIKLFVQSQLNQALGDHLSNDASSHGTARTYSCQGTVDPNQPLSNQFAICDPVNLLKLLKGEDNQTIDDIGALRKTIDPSLQNSHEFKELARQTYNVFSYTLTPVFISEEVLTPVRAAANRTAPLPRVEQYRWLVRADIISKTYYAITYPLTINYDIVVNVNVFDSGFTGCSGASSSIKIGGFGGTQTANGQMFCGPENGCVPVGITTCATDANGIIQKDSCSSSLYGSTGYQTNCCGGNPCTGDNDICGATAAGGACDVTTGVQACQVPSKPGTATFFVGGFGSAREIDTGCASGSTKVANNGQKTTSGYTWSTIVRNVSLGTNYN